MQAQLLQVPFSASWSREIIGDQDKFTPEMLLDELQEQNITVSLQHISTQLIQVCYSQMTFPCWQLPSGASCRLVW